MPKLPWPTLAALGVLAAVGISQGIRPDRTSASAEVQSAKLRLGHVAPSSGRWRSQELAIDRRELDGAEIDGCLLRRYSRDDGRAVTAMLVCGRPGPIAVHTPDVCYAGAGFRMEQPATHFVVDLGDRSETADFWSATFSKPGVLLPVRYQILWSWSSSLAWKAEDNPRLAFASSPVLFKLYLIRELPSNDPGGVDGSTVDFLLGFLPTIREAVFDPRPAPSPSGPPSLQIGKEAE